MLNGYVVEWMKLKRSPLLWGMLIVYLSPLILPHAQLLDGILDLVGGTFVLPFVATAFIFTREYQENTTSQLFTYPQKRQAIYVAKIGVIITIFIINLFFLYVKGSITVGDIHSAIICVSLVPFIVLIGIFVRNTLLSVIAQIGLGWFIHGQAEKLQNKYNELSPYHYDIRVQLYDFGWVKIKNILCEYLWATPRNFNFTMVFVTLSIVSTVVGIYLFSKRDISS